MERFASVVLVNLAIVNLKSGEKRVLEADVDASDVKEDGLVPVRLKRRRDGQVGGSVAVEDIDELGFLHCSDHDRATFRIDSKILACHNPARAGLAVRFLVHFYECVRLRVVVEDDDAARVRPNDHIVCSEWSASPAESGGVADAPLVPPVRRKATRDRIEPNTSCVSTELSLPVVGSGLSSSSRVPRETMIS